jgi:hypothetical protein
MRENRAAGVAQDGFRTSRPKVAHGKPQESCRSTKFLISLISMVGAQGLEPWTR